MTDPYTTPDATIAILSAELELWKAAGREYADELGIAPKIEMEPQPDGKIRCRIWTCAGTLIFDGLDQGPESYGQVRP
jgi:hypothetical protein